METMKITVLNGRPAVFLGDVPVMTDITCGVRYKGADDQMHSEYLEGAWILTETEGSFVAECGGTKLTFAPEGKGFTVKCDYLRTGDTLPRCDDFVSFRGKLCNKVRKLVDKKLDARSREIIVLRYGLCGYHPKTQREVAAYLGISRSYVSRIEKKALSILKDEFGDVRPDFDD